MYSSKLLRFFARWRLSCIALLISITTFLSGCNTPPKQSPHSGTTGEAIEFIDLEIFDASLTRNMREKSEEIRVIFPNQAVSINDLPDRIQPWLSAVHDHGGGVRIETEQGYVKKDLMGLVGIVISGYRLFQQSVPLILGRQYGASIVLEDGGNGAIDSISFFRI